MRDWREKLDAFLQFNQRDILTHAGRVEKAVADKLAEGEYDKFQVRRLAAEAGDDTKAFNEAVKKLPGKKPRKRPNCLSSPTSRTGPTPRGYPQ